MKEEHITIDQQIGAKKNFNLGGCDCVNFSISENEFYYRMHSDDSSERKFRQVKIEISSIATIHI